MVVGITNISFSTTLIFVAFMLPIVSFLLFSSLPLVVHIIIWAIVLVDSIFTFGYYPLNIVYIGYSLISIASLDTITLVTIGYGMFRDASVWIINIPILLVNVLLLVDLWDLY